jgi:hypothetical protein
LQLEELESSATEDEIAAEMAVAKTTTVAAFTRKRPARKPFPDHLPRERVIVRGPSACLRCGGERLRKLGETVTETLESIPSQWKVIQHVRAKFTCRDCEKIAASPDPHLPAVFTGYALSTGTPEKMNGHAAFHFDPVHRKRSPRVVRPSASILDATVSAAVRDMLATEITTHGSVDAGIDWVRRSIAAKNTLTAEDAGAIDRAFRVRMQGGAHYRLQ